LKGRIKMPKIRADEGMGWRKVGVVGVDSGQVMICDPCYINSEWDDDDSPPIPTPKIYRDKETGKTYAYAGFLDPEKHSVDVAFDSWDQQLDDYDGLRPNSLLADGRWEEVDVDVDEELQGVFSYPGVCKTTISKHGFGQLKYKAGHAGVGVASRTLIGDGCYPVFAQLSDDGRPEKLVVDFRVSDYDRNLKPEDIADILSDPTSVDSNGMPRQAEEIMTMIMERQAGKLWPAMRRLQEGADMVEELIPFLEEPIEGADEAIPHQEEAVANARKAIFHVRALVAALENASRIISESDDGDE
jgi:hypothetical protein